MKTLTGDEFHVETAPLPTPPPPPPKRQNRRPALLAGALAVVVAGGVLGWQLWPKGDDTATGDGARAQTSLSAAPVTFGKQLGDPIEVQENDVRSIAFIEVGGVPMSVSGGDDNTVRVVDLDQRTELYAMSGHEGWVGHIVTGVLDGAEIAVSASNDGSLRIWDLRDGTQMSNPMLGHQGNVKAVDLGTLNGEPIAISGGQDGTVRVWNLHSGEQDGESMTGTTGTVWAVAYAEVDGKPIAVSAGTRVWSGSGT